MSTKMKLIGDRVVPALAIGVDTRDGNVTLFGIVPTTAAKDAAGMDAKNTDGVRSVTNDLQVVASANREMVNAKDEIVTVKTALQAQSDFKHINVSVKNGVARLTGKLPSGWRRLDAVTLVRATTGVRSVDDELRP
jgi:osmotically-inducible protein OsmY